MVIRNHTIGNSSYTNHTTALNISDVTAEHALSYGQSSVAIANASALVRLIIRNITVANRDLTYHSVDPATDQVGNISRNRTIDYLEHTAIMVNSASAS